MKKLSCEQYIFAFGKGNQPALTVNSGEVVEIQTMDCFSNQIQRKEDKLDGLDWERINPATGPIYVEGAQKGDVLKVTIEKIEIAEQGAMCAGEGLGVLGDRMKGMYEKLVPIKEGKAIFNDRISLPLNKMIGVIGVAPEEEEISCGTPGNHGGNMDNKMITENAVLYFPVFTEGALFALGDVHAVMGDGEIGVSAVEIPATVTVKLEVVKEMKLINPYLENETHVSTIASAINIEDAIHQAVHDMEDLLAPKLSLETPEMAMLFSAAGSVEICQVVDPLKTVRFNFPKWILGE